MESFEAIVRNLEQAQRRGLETMTNRLDFVIESLQELVNEATASVREAIPADAEELFPVAEVRAAVQEAQARASGLARRVAELEGELQALREAPAPAAAPGGPSLAMLRTLDAARSQSELLRQLLPILRDHAGRAVVLVLREGRVSAWSGIGLGDAERLRLWSGEAVASPALERLTADTVPCLLDPGADPVFSTWLAGEPPAAEAVLVPVVLRGRLVGAIYADRVEGQPWDPETVQSLVALSCWLIDTLPYRQTVPSPPLAEPESVGDEETPVEAEEESEAEPAVTGEPEAPAETEAVRATEAPVEAEPTPSPDVDEAPEPVVQETAGGEQPREEAPEPEAQSEEETPGYDPSATVQMEVVEPVAPAADEAPAQAAPVVEEAPAPSPVQPVTPPAPGEAPAAPPEETEIPPEEQPLHEEAKRFARLLVSEIKLYNEEEVEQGRANHDIYQRLKEDIDRSREMYDQRVAPEVRRVRDYFHEELVRILGGGDPDTLGM